VAAWARRRNRDVRVIPNFAREPSVRRPAGGTGSRKVIAMGSLTWRKGFDMLLDAFAAAAPPEWTLEILGEGSEREALLARSAVLGVADRFSLPGLLSDPSEKLAGAEIFALSSRAEGFPHALAEAMAA